MNLSSHILNLFFPQQCFLCHKLILTDLLLCFKCLSRQKLQPTMTLTIESNTKIRIYSLFQYKTPFNHIILSKFFFEQSLLKLTANITPFVFRDLVSAGCFNSAVFVPIPIHWFRKFQRGFNQTEVFSTRMSELFSVPTYTILQRKKWTVFQSKLNPTARRLNVRDAFIISNSDKFLIAGKKIIIIDDLCTTGSTLLAAAKKLLLLNPKEIMAIVICR